MTVVTVPDVEKLIAGYLLAHPRIVAMSLRIVGRTPSDTAGSWVRLTQLDAPSVGRNHPAHLYEAFLQLDCYASAKGVDGSQRREAIQIAQAVHDVLADLKGQNYQADDAVISGTNPNMGLRRPDTDFEPARERFISTATIWIHS